jgi:hypothetical protein
MLDMLDEKDYERCIKGFLYTTQKILELEMREADIKENLTDYFFNEEINTLESERDFLLQHIKRSNDNGTILDNDDNGILPEKLEKLKEESHMLPFLEWE